MQNSTLPIQRLKTLLQLEYESEKAEYKIQTEKMGIGRKIKRGICWYPLSIGRSYYNSLNQLVVEVSQKEPQDIEHNFEYGRPVVFFSRKRNEESREPSVTANQNEVNRIKTRFLPFTCQVSYVDDNRMVVTLPSSQALIDIQNAEDVGIQLYFDETSYRTMFHALDDVINAKKNRLAELRDIFAGQIEPQKYKFNALTFPWLDPTQEKAVNEVLWAKDVAIVQTE